MYSINDLIYRHGTPKKFTYFKNNKQVKSAKLIKEIESLAIPPAWKAVQIDISPGAKVVAKGIDTKGREQSIYSDEFRAHQDAHKFAKLPKFYKSLPKLRKQIIFDISSHKNLDKQKLVACMVSLMDQAHIRVGNKKYSRDYQHYGLTTLRYDQVRVLGDKIELEFIGKSGKLNHAEFVDRHIAQIITALEEDSKGELFYCKDGDKEHAISSHDINDYIKQFMGPDFSAKDFRTWAGTVAAGWQLLQPINSAPDKDIKKLLNQSYKAASLVLNNTPAICKKSYIDSKVIDWIIANKRQAPRLRSLPSKMLHKDEKVVGKIITSIYRTI